VREPRKVRRGVVYAVGFVLLAVAPVIALNSLATANPNSGGYGHGPGGGHQPKITDAQRQCLTEHGATLPAHGTDSSHPHLTPQQHEALHNAAAACGLAWRLGLGGLHPHGFGATAEQLQCLSAHGVTFPARGPDGSHPKLNQAQIDALRRAANECGLAWHHGSHPGRLTV
jgi:hypothetical protein